MVFVVKFIAWFFSVVPVSVANLFGRAIGRLLFWVLASKRRLVREHLKHCFPEWSDKNVSETARGVFRTQGYFIADVMRLAGNANPSPLDMIDCSDEDLEIINKCLAQGKGLLVLTAHINNYEGLLGWAGQRYTMAVITKKIRPPSLDNYFCDVRRRSGVTILPRRGSYRDAVRIVRKGGILGFVIDQNMRKEFGIFVSFFGTPACTSPGLATMSAHTGASVLPTCLVREGARYRLKLYPIIPPPDDRKPESIQQATQWYSNVVEHMIREQPESWIWMHRRWKTQPAPGDVITKADGTVYHA